MSRPTDHDQFDSILLQASSEIILLIDGETLTVVAANKAACDHLGFERDALIGQEIGEFECALSDMFFWDEMRGQNSVVNVESSLRCADGSVLDVAKSVFKVSETPVRYTLRAVMVSSQNRIETELSNMGSRLRATLEATADGILLVDHEGAIINMNQRFSAMWNVPENLLINRDDRGIMSHLQHQRLGNQNGTDDAEPADDTDFETLYLKDGRVFECGVETAKAGEEIIGRVYSYRDVTERYRTQQELIFARDEAKRASTAKGEFLAMMSHEIRTPMNGVLGIAELLADTPLNEEQSNYVRLIRSSGETLLAILNDILDFSKIEAGKLQLEQTEFALRPMLDEINALFRFRLREGGPTFSSAVDARAPTSLRGDPVRLRQILFNLVGNAFKFTETGRIDLQVDLVETSQQDRACSQPDKVYLRFSVRDTGIGLTPEQVTRMFRSFEQADSSTTRKYGGTGLGLAICKRLVEMMGGEIGVNSVAGAGSEFWFTACLGVAQARKIEVPAIPASVKASTPADSPASSPLTPQTRVLLVEDNPVNRMVMSGMLKRLGGGEPVIACDGQEAVDIALRESFDVILMDSQMPVMDGLEATRRLRAAGLTTPIIGVSAGALGEERQAALDAGASDYVLKPVNLGTLGPALARALGGS